MKKYILILLFLLIPLHSLAIDNLPPKPVPARFFNNFVGGIISRDQANTLNSKLENYYRTSSNQIAIAVVKTTEPYEIAEYAIELGRKWGVGLKEKNNGVMIVWATNDREIFIATGYGVEGSLTDAMSKRIIETYIIPLFKTGQYFEGLNSGTSAIIGVLAGDPATIQNVTSPNRTARDKFSNLSGVEKFFYIIFIIFFVLLRFLGGGAVIGGSGGRSYGGGGSSFGGGSFGGGGAGGRY